MTLYITPNSTSSSVPPFTGQNAVGLYANRPAAGHKGNTYYATDSGLVFVDDGTAWRPLLPGGVLGIQPPLASAFTIFQTVANATLVDLPGSLFLSGLSTIATADSTIAVVPIPNPNAAYTLTVGFYPYLAGSQTTDPPPPAQGFFQNPQCGTVLYESTSNNTQYWGLTSGNSGAYTPMFCEQEASLRGTVGTVAGYTASNGTAPGLFWYRQQDDGLAISNHNLNVTFSTDGVAYPVFFQRSRVNGGNIPFVTHATHAGFWVNLSGANAAMRVVHFSLTQP